MTSNCQNCGAELIPETNFCRQCGAAAAAPSFARPDIGSEDPTTLLNGTGSVATQRLDPRPTGGQSRAVGPKTGRSRRTIIVAFLSVLVLIGALCAVYFFAVKNRHLRTSTAALIYPGSKTVVDMNYNDGGRALHLVTSDSLSKVESWYQDNLKPSKTMRLTPASVVLKSDRTTATLVAEDNQTNILIKMTP